MKVEEEEGDRTGRGAAGLGPARGPGRASHALQRQHPDACSSPAPGPGADSLVFHPQHPLHEADGLITALQRRKLSSGEKLPKATQLVCAERLPPKFPGLFPSQPPAASPSLLGDGRSAGGDRSPSTHGPAPRPAGLCLAGHTWPDFGPQTCSGQDHSTAGITGAAATAPKARGPVSVPRGGRGRAGQRHREARVGGEAPKHQATFLQRDTVAQRAQGPGARDSSL